MVVSAPAGRFIIPLRHHQLHQLIVSRRVPPARVINTLIGGAVPADPRGQITAGWGAAPLAKCPLVGAGQTAGGIMVVVRAERRRLPRRRREGREATVLALRDNTGTAQIA